MLSEIINYGPLLLLVSVLTNLTTEGIKRLLDESNTEYSANMLALIVSTTISILAAVVNCLTSLDPFSWKMIFDAVLFIYLNFLVSTVGYDKVSQTITQVTENREKNSK